MIPRKKIDWEIVEREYRAGQLSIREIGREYGVSHPVILRRAEKKKWERSLTQMVRVRVARKIAIGTSLDTNSSTNSGTIGGVREEEIVEAAAQRGVEIIHLHQNHVARQQRMGETLLELLETNPKNQLIAGKNGDKHVIEVPLTLREKSEILRNIAQASAKYIPLERQAYNLDADESESDQAHKSMVNYEVFLAAVILNLSQGEKIAPDSIPS